MVSLARAHSRMQDELFHRAHHDPLTDLPNRMLCDDRLRQAITLAGRYQRKIALLWIDLDEFKDINDRHGHEAGDFLLQQVGARIKSRLRAADTVARVGGDEFIAILGEDDAPEAVGSVAESVLNAIAEPAHYLDLDLQVTASIGVAVYPNDGTSADELKRSADQAMYRAKERGRNTYRLFSSALSERLARRMEIQQSLRNALAADGFEMYYQPQFTSAGRLVGLESLIRFRDPELKRISPGEFIPIAEEMGLMIDVGAWVIEEVCNQMRQWREEGIPPLPVSVNVSALQLARTDFASFISAILAKNAIPPDLLQVEITETAMMNDVEESRRQLVALEDIGVRLSLDDFGTGHSSLSYIHRLPVDTIKIDRSFVRHLAVFTESNAIVRGILVIARALELTVVAEGVETQEELDAVNSLGFDLIQGYLLSVPLDAQATRTLLLGNVERHETRPAAGKQDPETHCPTDAGDSD